VYFRFAPKAPVHYSVPVASAPPVFGTSAHRACAHVEHPSDLPIGEPSIKQSAHAFLKRLVSVRGLMPRWRMASIFWDGAKLRRGA